MLYWGNPTDKMGGRCKMVLSRWSRVLVGGPDVFDVFEDRDLEEAHHGLGQS